MIESGIKRTDRIKTSNRKRKRTKTYKRDRTHGKESKSKKAVLEARIDKDKQMGTYTACIAMDDSDGEQEDSNTQQLSNDSNNQSNNNKSNNEKNKKDKVSTKKKFCKWCNTETDHKTWRSVHCAAHPEYLRKQKEKQDKKNKRTHQKKENGNDVSCDENIVFNDGAGDVGAVGADRHCDDEKKKKLDDAALLLSLCGNNDVVV